MARVDRRAGKLLKKLGRQPVRVSLQPGSAPEDITALAALAEAEQALSDQRFSITAHICAQLINSADLRNEPYLLMLGVALGMKRPSQAADILSRIDLDRVVNPSASLRVAEAFRLCDRHPEGIAFLESAAQRQPANARIAELLGILALECNQSALAEAQFRRVIRLAPAGMSGYRSLAQVAELSKDEIAYIKKVGKPENNSDAASALALVARRRGDIDEEMHYLDLAQRKLQERAHWSPEADDRRAAEICEKFDADYFAVRERGMSGERQPVFLVGMPRSGSTLLERILSAHEDVVAIGESALFYAELEELSRQRYEQAVYPDLGLMLGPEDLHTLAQRYFRGVSDLYTSAEIFVDKQLENYNFVGLLYLAFPRGALRAHTAQPARYLLKCLSTGFSRRQLQPFPGAFGLQVPKSSEDCCSLAGGPSRSIADSPLRGPG